MRVSHDLTESLIEKYERYIAPFTFVIGFVFDAFTLKRIDFWIDHLILVGYLLFAGGGIAIFYAYESGRLHVRFTEWGIAFVPVVIQFSFGGLLSAFVIFYTTSASFGKNWIFILALAVLLIGNEHFRKRYERLVFQISIFFIALFSYSVFLMPLILGKLGKGVFFLGGILSIIFISLFLWGLSRITPREDDSFFGGAQEIQKRLRPLIASIATIYILFNILYFTNIIPPIPLSLKENGVYHSVSRDENGQYALRFEPAPWYRPFQETSSTFHWREGEPVFYFTSVFAPTRLTLPIVHRWSFYDEQQNAWVRRGDIQFSIFGGSDRGYRGYSFKTGIEPGKWRVEVATESGQTLGRDTFIVAQTENVPALTYATR